MKNDHRSKFSNLSNWKEEAWKNQGFNGIRIRDLRDTGAMLYQLSCEATHWERGQFIEFISPVRSEMASSFQLLKLENLLRWSFFTLIYNRSSNIWIISYILHIKILKCYHSSKCRQKLLFDQNSSWIKNLLTVLSCRTVYHAVQGSSNFEVCGWNPSVWPFKWKLRSSTFMWYSRCIMLYKVVLTFISLRLKP